MRLQNTKVQGLLYGEDIVSIPTPKRCIDYTQHSIREPERNCEDLNLASLAQNMRHQTQISSQNGNSKTACVECNNLPIIYTGATENQVINSCQN